MTDASAAANGTYDLGFALFDAANGIFTVQLDFGAAAFSGSNRYLEIVVKRPSASTFTTLAPRQQVISTPYAIRAVSTVTADTATDALNIGGTPAAQIITDSDTRLTDSRDPNSGSENYVQNTAMQQTGTTNFNISGNGTLGGALAANTVNSANGFNIGGSRVLSFGNDNLLVGAGAGDGITMGDAAYTTLARRQPLTAAPYAIRAQSAASADLLNGLSAAAFIRNGTAGQGANFNIYGSGTINGNLTVTGSINGTVSNATYATNVSGGFVQLPLTSGESIRTAKG